MKTQTQTTTEQWATINEYPNYEVSNLGQVRSLERTITRSDGRTLLIGGRILKQSLTSRFYNCVTLYNEFGKCSKNVHRLLLIAFVPNPNNYPSVNHKDEVQTNNHIDNLEWCSVQYNTTYNDAHIRNRNKVYQYTLDMELIRIWDYAGEACKALDKVTNQGISSVICGTGYSHAGFMWSNKPTFFNVQTQKELQELGISLEATIINQ